MHIPGRLRPFGLWPLKSIVWQVFFKISI